MYVLFKSDLLLEDYVKLPLYIETGRYDNTSVANRIYICKLCDSRAEEDEFLNAIISIHRIYGSFMQQIFKFDL